MTAGDPHYTITHRPDHRPAALPRGDGERMLPSADPALGGIDSPVDIAAGDARTFSLPDFSGAPTSTATGTVDPLQDAELDLRIELGRTQMWLEDVLKLRGGSVVPLDTPVGAPVDVFVGQQRIARGEVVVLNGHFCVRVVELSGRHVGSEPG